MAPVKGAPARAPANIRPRRPPPPRTNGPSQQAPAIGGHPNGEIGLPPMKHAPPTLARPRAMVRPRALAPASRHPPPTMGGPSQGVIQSGMQPSVHQTGTIG